MVARTPSSTRTRPLFPLTTHVRSIGGSAKCGHRGRRTKFGCAATIDHLQYLGVEFDLPYAAAAALQIPAWAEFLALGMMVADALRNLLNVADRTEIERSPPEIRPRLESEEIGRAQV